MGKTKTVDVKNPLEGLAKSWKKHHELREDIMREGRVLFWPTTETTGIISMAALKLNVNLLLLAAQKWVPQKKNPKTVPVDWVKEEVRYYMLYTNAS